MAARRARCVADSSACTAANIHALLESGVYDNPLPAAGDPLQTGVLMFKPGARVTGTMLDDLVQRCGECGYVISAARAIAPDVVRDGQLIRRHYRIHQDIAEHGGLTPEERLTLLHLYDVPQFAERYGRRPHEVPVMPVMAFLRVSGTPVAVVNEWSEATAGAFGLNGGGIDGANEIGDDKYVNLFHHQEFAGGNPVFLLNPHMPSVIGWYERACHPVTVLHLEAHTPDALPWIRMRRDFCGGSDPALAAPGSLRRDSYEGVFPLTWEAAAGLSRANNGVHLSNGPVEALRELVIWFDRRAEQTAAGRALAAAGVPLPHVLERSYLHLEGVTKLLTEATKGATRDEAVALLQKGQLLEAHSRLASEATLLRVDVAQQLAKTLSADPAVIAVIATGSVSRNRASGDSDLDLVVVAEPDPSASRETRHSHGRLVVEIEWMTPAAALAKAEAAAGDLKSLRESSRLAFGLPVYDPRAVCAEYRAVSRALTPDRGLIRDHLISVSDAFDALEQTNVTAAARWTHVRAILDTLAVVLLAMHPLRYQKPKFVIQDLHAAGWDELADALLHAYGVTGNADAARDARSRAQAFVALAADRLDLPAFDVVLRDGLLDRVPEVQLRVSLPGRRQQPDRGLTGRGRGVCREVHGATCARVGR